MSDRQPQPDRTRMSGVIPSFDIVSKIAVAAAAARRVGFPCPNKKRYYFNLLCVLICLRIAFPSPSKLGVDSSSASFKRQLKTTFLKVLNSFQRPLLTIGA